MSDQRRFEVLGVLVEEYIRTGEPVGSHTVLEAGRLGVSSATIRNDLVALEREGYVAQPHTSAGRIPTDKGFRYYVDHADPAHLRARTRERIHGFFSSVHRELRHLLRDTSDLLADISSYPSVVLGPDMGGDAVRGAHLVELSSQAVLVVVVTEAGRVSQEIVRLPTPVERQTIEEAEALLAGLLVGRAVADAGGVELPPELSDATRSLLDSVCEAVVRTEEESRDMFVGGTRQLASLWEDLGKVQAILGLLETETGLLDLVDRIDAAGTAVLIGSELGVGDAPDLAIISTTYGRGEKLSGRVAVLGPLRMNYRRAIKVVEEVGEGLSSSLGT